MMIDMINDWAAIMTIFVQVATLESKHGVFEVIVAKVVLVPQFGEVSGETFIQPAVGPISACYEVAEPLVCQLMGDERYIIIIQSSTLIKQQHKAMRSCRGMFHCANKQFDDGLCVFIVRILDTCIVREEAHHLRRLAHIEVRVVLAIRTHIISDGVTIVSIF